MANCSVSSFAITRPRTRIASMSTPCVIASEDGEDPSLIQSLWRLGRKRGLFVRCQDLRHVGLCDKEGPHLVRCFTGCRWFSSANLVLAERRG
jgi:hypothetical protein